MNASSALFPTLTKYTVISLSLIPLIQLMKNLSITKKNINKEILCLQNLTIKYKKPHKELYKILGIVQKCNKTDMNKT